MRRMRVFWERIKKLDVVRLMITLETVIARLDFKYQAYTVDIWAVVYRFRIIYKLHAPYLNPQFCFSDAIDGFS